MGAGGAARAADHKAINGSRRRVVALPGLCIGRDGMLLAPRAPTVEPSWPLRLVGFALLLGEPAPRARRAAGAGGVGCGAHGHAADERVSRAPPGRWGRLLWRDVPAPRGLPQRHTSAREELDAAAFTCSRRPFAPPRCTPGGEGGPRDGAGRRAGARVAHGERPPRAGRTGRLRGLGDGPDGRGHAGVPCSRRSRRISSRAGGGAGPAVPARADGALPGLRWRYARPAPHPARADAHRWRRPTPTARRKSRAPSLRNVHALLLAAVVALRRRPHGGRGRPAAAPAPRGRSDDAMAPPASARRAHLCGLVIRMTHHPKRAPSLAVEFRPHPRPRPPSGFEPVVFGEGVVGGVWAVAHPGVRPEPRFSTTVSDFPWPLRPDPHPTGEQIRAFGAPSSRCAASTSASATRPSAAEERPDGRSPRATTASSAPRRTTSSSPPASTP